MKIPPSETSLPKRPAGTPQAPHGRVKYPSGSGRPDKPQTATAGNVAIPGGIVTSGKPTNLVITLPLPPKELHPNARPHHMVKARMTKFYRSHCCGLATWERTKAGLSAAYLVRPEPLFAAPVVSATFFHATAQRRDVDNSIASIKSLMDGLTDAQIWQDDHKVTWSAVEFAVDKQNPRVEITIREPDEEANHADD